MESHEKNLTDFMTLDDKGRFTLPLLKEIKLALQEEQTNSVHELQRLNTYINHVKSIITMQQGYAIQPTFKEELKISRLLGDVLELLKEELNHSEIQIIFDQEKDFKVTISKHKMLLILINLLRNAKDSVTEANTQDKKIEIILNNAPMQIIIKDNGIGIEPQNLIKIFSHGFTTKKNGHGFGLNSCAVAIQELGGKIEVFSEGLQTGATFVITF